MIRGCGQSENIKRAAQLRRDYEQRKWFSQTSRKVWKSKQLFVSATLFEIVTGSCNKILIFYKVKS